MRSDPGPCGICGAAHTTCRADSGPITAEQLPARDAAARTEKPGVFVAPASTSVFAPTPELGDGTDGRSFSTATYRGDPKKRKR